MLYRGKSDSDWHGFEWSNEERLVKSWGSPPCPPSSPPSTPCSQLNRRWQVFYSLFFLLLPLPLALNSTDDGKLNSIFSISILPLLLLQTLTNMQSSILSKVPIFIKWMESFKLMMISCIPKSLNQLGWCNVKARLVKSGALLLLFSLWGSTGR